jgi:hypothetical protein
MPMPKKRNLPPGLSPLSPKALRQGVTLAQRQQAGLWCHLRPGALVIKRNASRPRAHLVTEWWPGFHIPRLAVVPVDQEFYPVGPAVVVKADQVTKVHIKDIYVYSPEAYQRRNYRRGKLRNTADNDDKGAGGFWEIVPNAPKRIRRQFSDTVADARGTPRFWAHGASTDFSCYPVVQSVRNPPPSALSAFPNAEVITVPPEGEEDLEAIYESW